MRHLKIFEDYKDLPDIAKDIFGLTHTFVINDMHGDTGIRISGPIENKEDVEPIIGMISIDIRRNLTPSIRSRSFWVDMANHLVKQQVEQLARHGYKVDKWYNGAPSPDLSK